MTAPLQKLSQCSLEKEHSASGIIFTNCCVDSPACPPHCIRQHGSANQLNKGNTHRVLHDQRYCRSYLTVLDMGSTLAARHSQQEHFPSRAARGRGAAAVAFHQLCQILQNCASLRAHSSILWPCCAGKRKRLPALQLMHHKATSALSDSAEF